MGKCPFSGNSPWLTACPCNVCRKPDSVVDHYGACGLAGGEFAQLQLSLLQNAMLVAGIVTLVQLYSIGRLQQGDIPDIMWSLP